MYGASRVEVTRAYDTPATLVGVGCTKAPTVARSCPAVNDSARCDTPDGMPGMGAPVAG